MMGFGLLFSLLALGAIAYGLGWRPQGNDTSRTRSDESPLDILKARYARGEISKAEYDEMREELAR